MSMIRVLWCSIVLVLGARELGALQWRPTSCESFQAAVAADPNSVDAAARLGQCTVRDEVVIPVNGDSTRVTFRTSWAPALRALRHAVDVDPSYTRAYRPLFRMLLSPMRDGCSYERGSCLHVAPVLRDGDSVLTPARLVVSNDTVDTYAIVLREWELRSRRNLEEARTVAARWVSVAPNERQAHEYLGKSLLRLGEYATAADEIERAAALGTDANRRGLFWDRMEALVKSNRGGDARRVLDEAERDPARDTSQLDAYTFERLNALLGRHRPRRIDSTVGSQPQWTIPTAHPGILMLVASGDIASARRMVDTMASGPFMRIDARLPRLGPHHLELAQSYLAVGDTARAEAWLKRIDAPFEEAPFQFKAAIAYGGTPWAGHAWMLMGDVAAARGRHDEATAVWRRAVGLWSAADPEVQSVVNAARLKLEAVAR